MRKSSAAAVLLAVAIGVTVGVTGPATAQDAAPVHFTAEEVNGTSVITTDAGSLIAEDSAFKVKAPDGTTIAATPLTFRLDDFELPITADISGNTAVLTPRLDPAEAVYKPVALPYEDQAPWKSEYDREVAAWSRLTSTISMGATLGVLVGGIGGAAVGCVLGGLAGAAIASATIVGLFGAFLPAAGLGCVSGILAVGALGALAGQILIAAPVAVGAAIQYFTTINQPMPKK
ncbi:hypothetical protein [Nocardia caishijiensis]|uniref:DUF8020 domain-containing protein n=1 Tax=Nocardia caishijiensis TaxID=184756 RepID=A0ABQ6YHW4_9NOCA|nr:hypothetical protein [Nocardia caishijiensis]KAF0845301.1 hypothetical protein FNL39_108109 [Nocardia caishijiensis]